jgi:hypothetical protein
MFDFERCPTRVHIIECSKKKDLKMAGKNKVTSSTFE